MSRTISTHDSSPIHHKSDRQFLDADVMDQLVIGPLQEGAVDRNHRLETFTSHAPSQRDGMLFSNTDINVLLWDGFLEHVQTGARGHGGSNADDLGILFAKFD